MNADAVTEGPGRRSWLPEAAGYLLIAGAVWLGWEVLKAPFSDRVPPGMAIRLDPSSPQTLRRAAESELLAGRNENARVLAEESLSRAPFNAPALRVRGLVEARAGSVDRADEMLTLAGNWSLRDDPAHAWLVEHRLRRGDYGSAFAHADTLARRRPDLHPALFKLFASAAAQDPRAMPVLVGLMANDPPWRRAFLAHLYEVENGAPVVGGLAIALERTKAPFTTAELQQLYTTWLAQGRVAGVREIRARLRRPASAGLQDGGFDAASKELLHPFEWRLGSAPGMSSAIFDDDLRPGNRAYRLEYDGFGNGLFLEQLLLLEPGVHFLTGAVRTETPQEDLQVGWKLLCAETGVEAASSTAFPEATRDWERFAIRFVVPSENCSAQWLRLAAIPGDRRTTIAVWLDDLAVQRTGVTGAPGGAAYGQPGPARSTTH